jgi:hypothetical protein
MINCLHANKLHHTKCQYNDSDFTCYETTLTYGSRIFLLSFYFYSQYRHVNYSPINCEILSHQFNDLMESILIILDKSRKKLYVANDATFSKLFYFDNGDTLLWAINFRRLQNNRNKENWQDKFHDVTLQVCIRKLLSARAITVSNCIVYTIDFNENAINLSSYLLALQADIKKYHISAAEEEIYTCLNSTFIAFRNNHLKVKRSD